MDNAAPEYGKSNLNPGIVFEDVVPIATTVRRDEREYLDNRAAHQYATSRAGMIRLAVRYMIEHPEEVRDWHNAVQGQIFREGAWVDSLGNAVDERPTE